MWQCSAGSAPSWPAGSAASGDLGWDLCCACGRGWARDSQHRESHSATLEMALLTSCYPKMSIHSSGSVLYVCFGSWMLKHVSQTFLLTSKKAGKQMSKMHPFCVCHRAHSGVTLCNFVNTEDLQKSWTHNSVFSSCQWCLCSGLCIVSVWHHQWRTAAGKRVQREYKTT